MSKKHFDEYFSDLQKNYLDMIDVLKQCEIECSQKMVSPETIDRIKGTLEPIKDQYFSVLYMKYLLDKPAKKSKQSRYEKSTKNVDKNRYKEQIAKDSELIGGLLNERIS